MPETLCSILHRHQSCHLHRLLYLQQAIHQSPKSLAGLTFQSTQHGNRRFIPRNALTHLSRAARIIVDLQELRRSEQLRACRPTACGSVDMRQLSQARGSRNSSIFQHSRNTPGLHRGADATSPWQQALHRVRLLRMWCVVEENHEGRSTASQEKCR